MKQLFSLDDRLLACASFVTKSAKLADIGTDHAYLPVWLKLQGVISYAIASDINSSPLEMGRATAEKYNVNSIDFRLGNGLDTITPEDNITDVVIAGMGGEIISDILSASPITKNKNLNIILQPMTKSHILIKNLYQMGFEIVAQRCAVSHGKCYTILNVRFTGVCRQVDDKFCYLGKLDLNEEKSRRFLSQHIKHLENQGKGNASYLELAEILKKSL
jgi:tRNA (adenine22-N1)-methyltransferase